MTHDLTKGPVPKTITLYALPMFLGAALQQLYNVVDTWVVGRFVGSNALAAVGASYALMVFLTSVMLGLCMGCSVVFAMCFGKGDKDALHGHAVTSFAFVGAVMVVVTLFAFANVEAITEWLNIPVAIYETTKAYMVIIFAGLPAVFLYNFFAAYQKAVGDSVSPLIFLAVATATNIVLDIICVVKFSMGVSGAAYATIIAQYISGFAMGLYTLWVDEPLRRAFVTKRPTLASLKIIANYSTFTCLQQSVMNLGILMIQGLVNTFGTVVMAAFAAAVKIDSFAYMPAQEYANAFATFYAQNRGARKKTRMRAGVRWAFATSLIYCAFVSVLMWFFAGKLMGIFVDASEANVIAAGVRYLHIEGACYVGIGALFLFYGLYRAKGRPAMSLLLTVCSLGTRVVLAYALSGTLGVTAIWWAIPIGWFLADGVAVVCMKKRLRHIGKWHTMRVKTVAAMEEAERIAKDPTVKGYTDLDEFFKELDS